MARSGIKLQLSPLLLWTQSHNRSSQGWELRTSSSKGMYTTFYLQLRDSINTKVDPWIHCRAEMAKKTQKKRKADKRWSLICISKDFQYPPEWTGKSFVYEDLRSHCSDAADSSKGENLTFTFRRWTGSYFGTRTVHMCCSAPLPYFPHQVTTLLEKLMSKHQSSVFWTQKRRTVS